MAQSLLLLFALMPFFLLVAEWLYRKVFQFWRGDKRGDN